MFDSIQTYTVDGVNFIGMSESWKVMCLDIPDSSRVRFPGYDTAWIETSIKGQPCVVQAWRGNCYEYPGMPGGIGGEVGIYRLEPGRPIPTTFKYPPVFTPVVERIVAHLLNQIIHDAIEGLDYHTQIWWPYPALDAEIAMTFTNPLRGGEVFFVATPNEPARGYWMSRWMTYESYAAYAASGPHPAPTGYDMAFSVGDAAFDWKAGGALVRTR